MHILLYDGKLIFVRESKISNCDMIDDDKTINQNSNEVDATNFNDL